MNCEVDQNEFWGGRDEVRIIEPWITETADTWVHLYLNRILPTRLECGVSIVDEASRAGSLTSAWMRQEKSID